jgi:putative copper export protein
LPLISKISQTLNKKIMKRITKRIKMATSLLLMMFISILTFAQDAMPEKVDVNINTDGGATWYGQPWVWAIGVAVFILILVVLTRTNKSKEA